MKYVQKPNQALFSRLAAGHPRCAGWLPMGSGKTASTLMALVMRDNLLPVWPALILAPLRVASSVWRDLCVCVCVCGVW